MQSMRRKKIEMATRQLLINVLVLLGVHVFSAVAGPQNGDIRLAGGTKQKGRLEVYSSSTQKWGTVCYSHTSEKGAARAACRQLGYEDQANVGTVTDLGIPSAPESTPIALYELNCMYNGSATDLNNAAEHILRCTYTQSGQCTHKQDMAIECTETRKSTLPYDGEVRLTKSETGYPSSGVLEVYLNSYWGTVCSDFLGSIGYSADSACRQMGYTGSINSSSVSVGSVAEDPALDTLYCYSPYTCFTSCFNYPSINNDINCSQIVTITCTFNTKTLTTPGSETLCAVHSSSFDPFPLIRLVELLVGVFFGIVVIIVLFIVALVCCCCIAACPLHSYRQRRVYYEQIQ